MLLALTGCASSQQQVSKAATSPLNDLNLVHAKIPKVLADARRHPYSIPQDQSCEALAESVRALDEVLGPDLDAPASADDPGMIERGTDAAENEAVNVIQGAAEDVVPFRRWVRKLTGAERYSKKVAASIVAGTVQRSFLKGIAVARGCGSPGTSAPEASSLGQRYREFRPTE
jgi:hypothetical protein